MRGRAATFLGWDRARPKQAGGRRGASDRRPRGGHAVGEPDLDAYAGYVERNRLEGRSDHARWAENAVFSPGWDERTRLMTSLPPAQARTVVDFGCGSMALRSLPPPGVRYVPVDIARRDAQTRVLDLNTVQVEELPNGTVAFLSGTLEYIVDISRLVERLAARYRHIVCSSVATSRKGNYLRLRRRCG